MRIHVRIIVTLSILTLACRTTEPPRRVDLPKRSDGFARCERGIVPDMLAQVGGEFTDCGESRAWSIAVPCANQAFRRRKPFIACDSSWGMDSEFQLGVVGLPTGDLMIYYYDGLGPRLRGICPRKDVIVGERNWPSCGRALIDQYDLTTGRGQMPFEKQYPHDEAWSPQCFVKAYQAVRFPVRPYTKPQKVSAQRIDPSKYGLPCTAIKPVVDYVIEKSGRVRCVRVRAATDGAPPAGLYDEIRENVKRTRWEPPRIYGKPVDMFVEGYASGRDVCK